VPTLTTSEQARASQSWRKESTTLQRMEHTDRSTP
jgi:hypothetical protein